MAGPLAGPSAPPQSRIGAPGGPPLDEGAACEVEASHPGRAGDGRGSMATAAPHPVVAIDDRIWQSAPRARAGDFIGNLTPGSRRGAPVRGADRAPNEPCVHAAPARLAALGLRSYRGVRRTSSAPTGHAATPTSERIESRGAECTVHVRGPGLLVRAAVRETQLRPETHCPALQAATCEYSDLTASVRIARIGYGELHVRHNNR